MWAEIVEYFAAFAGIGTFLYFVIKLAIEKFMEAGLERYRSALHIDLETHKAELSRITQEHRIRLEHLHPERFSTIKNLHDQICECEDSLSYLTTLAQGPDWIREDRQRNTLEKLEELERLIRATKLYLEPSICKKLEDLHKFSQEIVRLMKNAREDQKSNEQVISEYRPELEDRLKQPLNDWKEADRKVKEDFINIRTEVEGEFRKLLSGI